jgi:hypothetical protein
VKVGARLGERNDAQKVKVLERLEGHYETQDVSFGKVYRWCPQCVVIQCVCGEKVTLASSRTICQCGSDHAGLIREELAFRKPKDEAALHPWRLWHSSEGSGIPF